MAYTFGGNTGDDVNFTVTNLVGSTNTVVGGMWIYPTTLTNGRYLVSWGNVIGIGIASTTSEVTFTIDATGTDGVYTTTGLGLVTNAWQFLGFGFLPTTAGPTATFMAWRGTTEQAPVAASVATTTAPTTGLNSSGAWTLGNRGTGSVAFQGLIGSCTYWRFSSADIGHAGPSSFPFSAADIALMERRFIMPLWSGQVRPIQFQTSLPGNSNDEFAHIDLQTRGGRVLRYLKGNQITTFNTVPTINTAVFSEERPPVIFGMQDYRQPPARRR